MTALEWAVVESAAKGEISSSDRRALQGSSRSLSEARDRHTGSATAGVPASPQVVLGMDGDGEGHLLAPVCLILGVPGRPYSHPHRAVPSNRHSGGPTGLCAQPSGRNQTQWQQPAWVCQQHHSCEAWFLIPVLTPALRAACLGPASLMSIRSLWTN